VADGLSYAIGGFSVGSLVPRLINRQVLRAACMLVLTGGASAGGTLTRRQVVVFSRVRTLVTC